MRERLKTRLIDLILKRDNRENELNLMLETKIYC